MQENKHIVWYRNEQTHNALSCTSNGVFMLALLAYDIFTRFTQHKGISAYRYAGYALIFLGASLTFLLAALSHCEVKNRQRWAEYVCRYGLQCPGRVTDILQDTVSDTNDKSEHASGSSLYRFKIQYMSKLHRKELSMTTPILSFTPAPEIGYLCDVYEVSSAPADMVCNERRGKGVATAAIRQSKGGFAPIASIADAFARSRKRWYGNRIAVNFREEG